MKYLHCYSVNIVNISKLFPIFEKKPQNTVFRGLHPGQRKVEGGRR